MRLALRLALLALLVVLILLILLIFLPAPLAPLSASDQECRPDYKYRPHHFNL
jgi:hypothetical protein